LSLPKIKIISKEKFGNGNNYMRREDMTGNEEGTLLENG
jgi:hypothetical protein